jgi:Flp pilus assembly protein TadB
MKKGFRKGETKGFLNQSPIHSAQKNTTGTAEKEQTMIFHNSFLKMLSLYLVFAMVLISLPAQGWAMFIPVSQNAAARQADISSIQKTLESTMIKQRLMDFGLSPQEAMARINTLSDDQIHQFASQLDSLQAGADDGLGLLIFLLVVVIVTVVVLEATGHRVIVR